MDSYGAAWEETDEGNEIMPDRAFNHSSYKNFLESIGQLEKVQISDLNDDELLCFFLNVYQCMYIQKFLKDVNSGQYKNNSGGGFFSNISTYFWNTNQKEFFYLIAGMKFTIEEIKHGIL